MYAIACAHPNTHATTLMCVKNSTPFLFMTLIALDTGAKKTKQRTKTSNLIVGHFTLTFVNFSIAWMLYFHVWLQNKEKFLVWDECYNQFVIYQPSCVSLIEPQQNNLSNTESYSEPCKTLKIECFGKIVSG